MGKKYYRHKELVGKDVYDSKAKRIGKVCDVGYSEEGRIALIVETEEGKEEIISFDSVSEIQDIILLKQGLEAKPEAKVEVEALEEEKPKELKELEKLCPKCGTKNVPKAKFCAKCGYKF
ncbi:MAG: PRC-barrel domain-containing protein [Candidatus Bathyarchaeia archaeon]